MLRDERGQSALAIIVFLTILLTSVFIYIYLEEMPRKKISILTASFDVEELLPGQSTTLTVKIRNMSDEAVAFNVSVAITSLTPSVVQVLGEDTVFFNALGPEKERLPTFDVFIAPGAIKGTYGITVSISVDPPFEGDEDEAVIRVI